jgi:hypothetical protein
LVLQTGKKNVSRLQGCRFLDLRIAPRIVCPYCGEEPDMENGPYEEMPAVIGNIFFNHRLKIHGLFFKNYSGQGSFFGFV